MKRILILLCLLLGWSALAQTSREELLSHLELTAGNYVNYPLPTGHLTPAPKGYEPFYISHYGRHGARYMTGDKQYRRLCKQLDSALKLGILTEYGKDVRHRVMLAAADARGRAGKLTELGAKQHKAIARRMYGNYEALLREPLTVRAMSSTSGRVMRSMENFCAELAELNPSLDIIMSATEAEQGIVKPNKSIPVPESETDGALYKKLKKFKHKMLSGEPQMAALFTVQSMMQPSINALHQSFETESDKVNFGLARGVGSAAFALSSFAMGRLLTRFAPSILPVS